MNIFLLCLTFTVFIFAVRLIGNRSHFRTIWRVTVKIELGYASYNYATVTSTVDTGSVRIKIAYYVKRVRFPYLGNDSDGR